MMQSFKVNGATREDGLCKKAKKHLVGGLLLVIAIFVFGYTQLNWFGATTESDTNWLMVLHAGEAEITETGGETFITLSKISRNTVFFSDRPERSYQSVDTNVFLAEWDTLFADSPPNVAMIHGEVGVDTEVVIIELFTPFIRFGEVSFPIKIVGGNYTKDRVYTDVNLFIDEVICFEDGKCFDAPDGPPGGFGGSGKDSATHTYDGVSVTVSGGHRLGKGDNRPIDLMSAMYGITSQQLRNAYGAISLDGKTEETYTVALYEQLKQYGVQEWQVRSVRTFYQYPIIGNIWSHAHAQLKAIIESNKVVGFEIIRGGYGYTSKPTVTVEGYGRINVDITISYPGGLYVNGAITAITVR